MIEDLPVTVHPNPVPFPKVELGPSSIFGFGVSLFAAVGALLAALAGNDAATITAGTSGVLLALGTIGGRMAQALVIAKQAAVVAEPIVNAVAHYGEDPETDAVTVDELPSDDEEFATAEQAEFLEPESRATPDRP